MGWRAAWPVAYGRWRDTRLPPRKGARALHRLLKNKRILIVEDEYFIATDLSRLLAAHGAIIVGPVGDLPAGLHLADREPLDAALLDVNLGGTFCYPIADRLLSADVPHLFLTGYDGSALPADYRHAPRIAKPFSSHRLIAAMGKLFDKEAA